MSGVGSLAGGAMMFSERDLKHDLYLIGKNRDGRNVYMFRYKFDDPKDPFHIGFMAEENPDLMSIEPMTHRKQLTVDKFDLEVA